MKACWMLASFFDFQKFLRNQSCLIVRGVVLNTSLENQILMFMVSNLELLHI